MSRHRVGRRRFNRRGDRFRVMRGLKEASPPNNARIQTSETMKTKSAHLSILLRPHWKTLSVALLAVLGESLAELLEPWPLKIVFDSVLGSKKLPHWMAILENLGFGESNIAVLQFAVVAVVVIAAIGAISSYTEKYLTTTVGQRVLHDLRCTLYHHAQKLSLSYHDQKRTGDLLSRVTTDIDAIQAFISQALLGLIVNALTLAGMLAVMFYLNWRFTVISLSVAPVLFGVVYSYTRRIKQATRAVREKEGQVVSVAQEVFSLIRVVKAFAREDYEQQRFEQQSIETVETALKARSLKAKLAPLVQVTVAAGTSVVLWYGVGLVMAGTITAGSLLVFLLYLAKMYKPMRELSKMTDTVSKAAVGFERIGAVLETEHAVPDFPGARLAPRFRGAIEFDHVSFGYALDCPVLNDVSFKIDPGQIAAFVGPTGAGKTTIASLVARFYDPLKGQVKIDGRDVRSYKQQSLRSQIGFVLQDTLLFRAPVWQNIAYGRPEASRDQIVRAATLANAHEFIVHMPDGYDTIVGERGVTLSGGQRQRIALARAIIRDAPILILDEPTSNLDAEAEKLVLEALGRLMQGKTAIVIAHRLATIRRADVIFVLDHGAITGVGNHQQLLRDRGLYSRLHEIQLAGEERGRPLTA